MKKLFLYTILFVIQFSFSQNQTDNQYLQRNAGIKYDYCSNTYSALTNSQFNIDPNQIQVGYSAASISDKYGELLFYTDGRTIWNRSQNPLPNANEANGTDIEGHGNTIMLPKPGDPNQYYVFTIDNAGFWNTYPDAPGPVPDDGVNNGLTYSVIDLSLNGGMGDIIPGQHSLPLITYNENDEKQVAIKSSTKLTVVRGADCQSYWIITHFTSSFYAFKLDSTGLNPNPVISNLIPFIDVIERPNLYWYHSAGQMKSSPDGTKIAVAHLFLDNEEINGDPGGIFLYDFNNVTGILSNVRTIFLGEGSNEYPHSLEFSESSKYLYASTQDDITSTIYGTILRWNIELPNISMSGETIENEDAQDPILQLGSDNKIYKSLSPIMNNESDQNRYIGAYSNTDGFFQNITYERQSLLIDPIGGFENFIDTPSFPQFNRQWFNERIDIINNGVSRCELYICNNESKTLSADFINGADYVWSKDGVIITTATSNTLEVTEIGFYEVFIETNNGRCPIEGRATVLESTNIPTSQDANLVQCDDDNDGFTTFNLSLLDEIVSNNETNRTVQYYESEGDLNAGTNQLNTTNFQNTSNPQIIYALIISTENGCTASAEVNLNVSVTTVNGIEIAGCDTDENSDGFGVFDLADAQSQILNNLPEGLNVTFHETYQDALTANFPLDLNYNNIVAYNQTIYARVVNGLDCYGISEIDLTVYDIPELETNSESLYCINNSPETLMLYSGIIDGNSNNYTYLWSTGEITSQIEVNEIGIYSVEVTNISGCVNERTINVFASNIATITNIEVTELNVDNSISVFVTGEGDYEYALNDINGTYQDSNSFSNLQPGIYTVFVRDKNNCGIVNENVSVLGFPKFFTPNGDLINDFWQIKGLSDTYQLNSSIFIFNRYGKFIAEIDPRGQGWDGTHNGIKLPTNDYWFKVKLEDGRMFTNHFTLKR